MPFLPWSFPWIEGMVGEMVMNAGGGNSLLWVRTVPRGLVCHVSVDNCLSVLTWAVSMFDMGNDLACFHVALCRNFHKKNSDMLDGTIASLCQKWTKGHLFQMVKYCSSFVFRRPMSYKDTDRYCILIGNHKFMRTIKIL